MRGPELENASALREGGHQTEMYGGLNLLFSRTRSAEYQIIQTRSEKNIFISRIEVGMVWSFWCM